MGTWNTFKPWDKPRHQEPITDAKLAAAAKEIKEGMDDWEKKGSKSPNPEVVADAEKAQFHYLLRTKAEELLGKKNPDTIARPGQEVIGVMQQIRDKLNRQISGGGGAR